MKQSRTPLHEASVEGRLSDVVALLSQNADVAAADEAGFTALHLACQQGNHEIAEALLRAGAQVDVKDSWGNTPLWRATFAFQGDTRLIRLLLDHGANPDLANNSGRSPRQMAAKLDRPGMKFLFR